MNESIVNTNKNGENAGVSYLIEKDVYEASLKTMIGDLPTDVRLKVLNTIGKVLISRDKQAANEEKQKKSVKNKYQKDISSRDLNPKEYEFMLYLINNIRKCAGMKSTNSITKFRNMKLDQFLWMRRGDMDYVLKEAKNLDIVIGDSSLSTSFDENQRTVQFFIFRQLCNKFGFDFVVKKPKKSGSFCSIE